MTLLGAATVLTIVVCGVWLMWLWVSLGRQDVRDCTIDPCLSCQKAALLAVEDVDWDAYEVLVTRELGRVDTPSML